uniref:Uncharacterized protein n=1 Tax=viral metagenome TaxID=1070528 RepID=A0A6C0HZ72_9ZZZZ
MEVINLTPLEEVKTTLPGIELLMNDKKKENTIKISDVDMLEKELNSLSGMDKFEPEMKLNFSEIKEPKESFPRNDPFPRSEPTEIKIEPTVRFAEPVKEKTWDGFKPFVGNPDKPVEQKETLRERFSYLRKLEDLESKGVKLTKRYSMDSSLEEMKGEYENIVAEKEKANNVKFQGKMLMACITGIEFLNSKFDPFDIKLDGWAEQFSENITDYDEIFAELHEKYRNKAKLAPELKLLFQLGGSAIMLHMTNTMFKSSMPGLDDIMRQNPELMQKFTQAAMSSVSPGLSGFMNTVQPPREFARQEPYSRPEPREVREVRTEKPRPEMKGPSDINDILNGLKPKTVQMDEGSTVSLSELNEMKDGLGMAKKGRRKRSDKMTMNLNL